MSALAADKSTATSYQADAGNLVACGATLAMSRSTHAGKTILLDTAAGSVATLPASTGSGASYTFLVSLLATSNSHKIQVANGTDIIQGFIATVSDDASGAGKGWIAGASDDTITLNRSTTGSVSKGERITVMDIAAGVYMITDGRTASSGTEATPFSSAV